MNKKSEAIIIAGLYIVATPIGNMGDITYRAVEILKSVDIIACEDTRATSRLLSHYDIKTKTTVYNDHSSEKSRQRIIDKIISGNSIALVSDAGTPLISDPGYKLVRQAAESGINITTIPGASSVIAALTLSALPTNRFLFEGFLPVKQQSKRNTLAKLADIDATLIFMERNSRLVATLNAMFDILGNRDVAVIREITKLFEESKRGTLEDIIKYYEEEGEPKGEIVIVVSPNKSDKYDIEQAQKMLRDRIGNLGVKAASNEVSEITGISKKELYNIALSIKNEQ